MDLPQQEISFYHLTSRISIWFKDKIAIELFFDCTSTRGVLDWGNLYLIFVFIDKANLNHTLILSGDRHRAGIYEIKTESGKRISEVTSSSLNASFPSEEEYGPLRIGKTFIEENYGLIFFDSEKNDMFVGLKDVNGEVVRKTTISN